MSDAAVTPVAAAAPALLADALRAFGVVRLRATGSSMTPAIQSRDTLVVAASDAARIRPRDVVLFTRDGRLFAHRVIEIVPCDGGPWLRTRGDALWRDDRLVAPGDLLGVVVAVGRDGAFTPPAACTALGRLRALVASECTFLTRPTFALRAIARA